MTEELYHSPMGVLDFQAEGAARAIAAGSSISAWDTGTGKTHLAMLVSAILHADRQIDTTLFLAESGKVKDFVEDEFGSYTRLRVGEYTGTVERRARRLAEDPQVLVTSHETARNDICTFKRGGTAVTADGPLTQYLRGRRVLYIVDESAKLTSRKNQLYRANDYLLNRVLRRDKAAGRHTRALLMTGTTSRRDPIGHFNLGRLVRPDLMPTVAEFNRDHVVAFDPSREGEPLAFKNLWPGDDIREHHVVPLTERMAPFLQRVRKSDPEVAKHFPRMVENEPTVVRLSDLHYDLIDAVHQHFGRATEDEQGALYGMVRQLVDHPESVLYSDGAMAREVSRLVGVAGLRAVGSRKVEALLRWVERRVGSGQGVAFTFYGQSVLPVLARELRAAGHSVSVNHGQMTPTERQRSKREFTSGQTKIFLSSDAGARGLNLGCAHALLHVEPPLTYDTFVQRSNRAHRVDSPHAEVDVDMLVGLGTPDERVLSRMLRRNDWHEQLLDSDLLAEGVDPGEHYLTADDRREMMSRARRAA